MPRRRLTQLNNNEKYFPEIILHSVASIHNASIRDFSITGNLPRSNAKIFFLYGISDSDRSNELFYPNWQWK